MLVFGITALAAAVVFADDYSVRAMVRQMARRWLNGGESVGDRVFSDNFSDEAKTRERWTFRGDVRIGRDAEGISSASFRPRQGGFTDMIQKESEYIHVKEGSILAIYWRARAGKGGNAPALRIDAFDKNRRHLMAHGERSVTDPTEPMLFTRNMLLATERLPKETKFLKLHFYMGPAESNRNVFGEVADVFAVDLKSVADAEAAKRPNSRIEYEKAERGALLVNVSDDVSGTFPVMPESSSLPGNAGDTLRVRDCAGETVRATAILRSKCARKGVRVEFSDLKSGTFGMGGVIPASALSAKTVKVHYQCYGTPDMFIATGEGQQLVPELLLNDDDLVRLDHDKRHNLVKFAYPDGERHVDVNEIPPSKWGAVLSAKDRPIKDADTLQPFELEEGMCKQIVLFINIPNGVKPGVYGGKMRFLNHEGILAESAISLEVLPFDLPVKAETVYSPDCEYTMGLYSWGELLPEGADVPFSILKKSREQLLNTLKILVAYGITSPILTWHARTIYNETVFRRHLEVAREAGLNGTLYLGESDNIGNSTDPDALKKLKENIRLAKRIAKEYGFDDVYFYGFDEAQNERLVSQRTAWNAVHEAGGKVIVSGYLGHFEKVGDLLDICVYAAEPETANPAAWHTNGKKIWKYATPQTGPEDPNLYRRAYGLPLWRMGFDGACTYCFCGDTDCWDDLSGTKRRNAAKSSRSAYRAQAAGYLTVDGAVETLPLVGLADAMKDVRYMSLFRKLLREKPNAAAQSWYDSIDFREADLGQLRKKTVDWILKLTSQDGKSGSR